MNPKFTLSRLPASILSAALALTIVARCAAAPAAPVQTASPDTVTYVISNHNGLVTLTDGVGKTLLTRHIATPNVLAVINKTTDTASKTNAKPAAPDQAALTLEDQNGLHFWTTRVAVAGPMVLSMHFSSNVKGTEFSFTHTATDTSDPNKPSPSQFGFTIDSNSRVISMKVGDKTYKIAYSPKGISMDTLAGQMAVKATSNGAIMTGPNGPLGGYSFTKDGKSGTMVINGTTIPLTAVKRDGKNYFSFPWNGHQVLVEDGCTISPAPNGDLTVDAPAQGM